MKTFRLLLALVLAGCAVAAAVTVFGPMLAERNDRAKERDGLRAENDELERRIAELRRKQNEFETNPEYVELTARRENRTKSGETVFDFGESSPDR